MRHAFCKTVEQNGCPDVFSMSDDKLDRNEADTVAGNDFLSRIQRFLDDNVRIVNNLAWVVAAVGVGVIIKRTYALHHFSHHSQIPDKYFENNATLFGKVVSVNQNGCLGVQHFPLLWQARLKYLSEQSSHLLNINITGVKLQSGALEYLNTNLKGNNVRFQLLGKDTDQNIESILYLRKPWFGYKCINEDIVLCGLAVANHIKALSNVAAYNKLIESLVKSELKAVKSKAGIWQETDSDHNTFYQTWSWLKSKAKEMIKRKK